MRGQTQSRKPRRSAWPVRWWNTLAFRLGIVVNLTAVAVLGVSAWLDHRRDAATQLQHALTRLHEEARILRATWSQFDDPAEFQRFVDEFCRQMTTSASPGHHIVVFDAGKQIVVRAHERADPGFERLMSDAANRGLRTLEFKGERFASVSLKMGSDTTLAVAVSLKPVETVLRIQGRSRAVSACILVVVLSGVTTLCLLSWVRDPLHDFVRVVSAVANRQFDRRVRPRGTVELRYLAEGINNMVRVLERAERQRTSELKQARDIQQAWLDSHRLTLEGFEVEAVFLPAATVGGDSYGFVTLPDQSTLLAVIDVTGHGVPGALCTALLRSSLRHLARVTSDLADIAGSLNRDLCDISTAGMYATALLIKLRRNLDSIEYVSAGHDPPVLVRPGGQVERFNYTNMLFGVKAEAEYVVSTVPLSAGSRLLVYTDGLHEAMSPKGRLFGRQELSDLFGRTGYLPLDEQLATVLREIRSFQGRDAFDDDVTVLAIRWAGSRVVSNGPTVKNAARV